MPDPKIPERHRPTPEQQRFAHEHITQFPHCDSLILHAPSTCRYCDEHPDWQALRIAWEINFTGEDDPTKAPCPSTRYRPTYQAHRWHGNRPTEVEVETQAPTAWEHLNGDDEPV